jgi:homoserine O-acetyltransferase
MVSIRLLSKLQDFITRDIARIFIEGLRVLILLITLRSHGGSVGGGIAWEILALEPSWLKTWLLIGNLLTG